MTTPDENSTALAAEGFPFGVAGEKSKSGAGARLKSGEEKSESTEDLRVFTQSIRRGDAAAFGRFYDLYSFRLYRFLLVLSRGDENAAREVCQTTMMKLAKRFQVFDEERRLWAWVCAEAKNCFLDHCRAQTRRGRFISLDELSASVPAADDSSAGRLSELLGEAMAGLASEERDLLQGAYVDERSVQELADASGLTYKAVESKLARLRQRLKEKLLRGLRDENKP